MTSRITFVIPTYNAAAHLACCLNSIRRQDYPQELVDFLVIDGGSTDSTLAIASKYQGRILNNPKRLAEYGVQMGVMNSSGDFLVIFAADNELVEDNWISKVADTFNNHRDVDVIWGRLASGKFDSNLNKYFELIQSDPLNWFLNNNLTAYLKSAELCNEGCLKFEVNPDRPLVWGANGLAYRRDKIVKIWEQEGYLGDNDAFQALIEQSKVKVAYFNRAFVYHHHVACLSDFIRKWKRNFLQHLASKHKTRNMNWVFSGNFKIKIFLWFIYSGSIIIVAAHSFYLAAKARNIYWLYHPLASITQLLTYVYLVLFTGQGRKFIINRFFAKSKIR